MSRPWELRQEFAPWLTQQPLYERVVSVRRPIKTTSFGSSAYGGLDPIQETVILSGLPASIQIQRQRASPQAQVPGDAQERTGWRIFIPPTVAVAGDIVERDIIADDLGRRFHVISAMPIPLGFELTAELLEA